ncbi:MAG: hypothetical protein Q7T97_06125 [Burkholderiaceae bacterium]|nr:hypothetical protein [Burkholderiaceae bacterium]
MFALTLVGAGLLGSAGLAAAQTTGGTTTKTLEYRARNVTSVTETQTVETYETRMLGFLAGNPNALVDVLFALPFGDAAVQAAAITTRNLLSAASADPLSFWGPTLTSSSRVLSGSSSASSEVLTSEEVLWVDTAELVGEELFHLNSSQFGCIAEVNGVQFDCSFDYGDLFVAAGDSVLLTSAGIAENYLRTTVTTDTFLNSSVYEIVGTPDIRVVPEPSTALLVALAGLIGWRSTARQRIGRA